MTEEDVLVKTRTGSGTCYLISESYIKNTAIAAKALGVGLEVLKNRGKID